MLIIVFIFINDFESNLSPGSYMKFVNNAKIPRSKIYFSYQYLQRDIEDICM